jgi:hypothetical protein
MATVIISSVGLPGLTGPQGDTGPQGIQGIQGPSIPFSNLGSGAWRTTSSLQLSGSLNLSASFIQLGSNTITGSFSVSGSTLQTGNNTLIGNTTLSGSIEVSGSSNFHNSSFTVTGSSNFLGNTNIQGNLNVISGSSIYLWGNKLFNYGAFSSTITQPMTVANQIYSMSYDTTDIASGISVENNTRITVAHTGLYNLQFSSQFYHDGNTTDDIAIWFRITGSNVANSATDITLAKQERLVAAWNFVTQLSSGSYIEILVAPTGNDISMVARAARTSPVAIPVVPSVIATLTQIA